MALTDTKVRAAKAADKQQKLYDERGLFLIVTTTGSKYWRFKYRFNQKEKMLSIGTYPDISLSEARDRREEARKRLSQGIDPSEYKKVMKTVAIERQANSFEVIAREWIMKKMPTWKESHSCTVIRRLERDIFPWLGDKPITEITPHVLLKVLRQVEERGTVETARRILSYCAQIFYYAVSSNYVERNPALDLKGALPPTKKKHFAAPTEPEAFAGLLKVIEGYQGNIIVRCALRLTPHVFVRPGELRSAKWADIDFNKAEWRYTVSKTDTPHIVPLSRQSIDILKEIQPVTEDGPYVFPCARTPQRPMSENAILGALRRLGITKEEATGHGFRATARTLLEEVLGFRIEVIEHQLAHAVRDPNGRAYNRTKLLDERKRMMQEWSDYVDSLKKS